jgi:hypothetical protein
MLVSSEATHPGRRGTPKAFTTIFLWKRTKRTQVIPVPNGNHSKRYMDNPLVRF